MVAGAKNFVVRNPIKTLLYCLGVMLCVGFSGTQAPVEIENDYQQKFQELDTKYGRVLAEKHQQWR